MRYTSKIFVGRYRGLVGSAILRALVTGGYADLVTRTHAEPDLADHAATAALFALAKPEYVFLAAAKVGGIVANNTYPADFIGTNLAAQNSVIDAAWTHGVRRLLFLGSSCIYPKLAPQPLEEKYLFTGPLEPTKRPYALAKIAGIEICWSYNRRHGTRFLAAMPTIIYGPADNHPENSHLIPAMIRKFHEARPERRENVVVWGSGTPRKPLDVSRLESMGWKAPTTLDAGLRNAYADYVQHLRA